MKIYIWDKEYNLPIEAEDKYGNAEFTKGDLKQIKDLIAKETEKARSEYNSDIEWPKKDLALVRDFITFIEKNPGVCWPGIDDLPEETAYEKEVWDFIDLFAASKFHIYDNYTDSENQEILIYIYCPELIAVSGKETILKRFGEIIYFEHPESSGEEPWGILGEMVLQGTALPFFKQLLKVLS